MPGSGYSEAAALARTVLNKWNRKKHNIATRYDEEGNFDQGWEDLKRQLDDERDKVKKQRLESTEE